MEGSCPTVADGFRLACRRAGLDLVELGVRDAGPLNWTPPDRITEPEPRVAGARRGVLARRKFVAIDREIRAARALRREVAA